jgi:hypothetical protein
MAFASVDAVWKRLIHENQSPMNRILAQHFVDFEACDSTMSACMTAQ